MLTTVELRLSTRQWASQPRLTTSRRPPSSEPTDAYLRRGGAKLTVSPTGEWMAQRARNLAWKLQDGALKAKFLLHDRHCKFTAGFNQVFRSEGVQVLRLPFRGPRANSIAERFVLTARRELLDHLLIFSARHLEAGDQGVLGPLSPGAPAPRSRTACLAPVMAAPMLTCMGPTR